MLDPLRHRLLNKDSQVIILALIFFFCFSGHAELVAVSESGQPSIVRELSSESGNASRLGFKAMSSRFMKSAPQKSPDEKLHDVSDMYEKHFLREMMKAMRSTVHESGFIQQNQAEKIFREQLDDHYVDRWSEKGGIGLSKMIYEQLVQKFGVQLGIKNAIVKPQGPLPIDEKSNFTAHPFRHPGKKQSLSYRIDKKQLPDANGEPNVQVKAPWNGVVVAEKKLPDQQTLLEIEHDNGLKSQVAFKGELSKVSTGAKVQGGDTLGVLSAESKTLYWVVEPGKSPGTETVSE